MRPILLANIAAAMAVDKTAFGGKLRAWPPYLIPDGGTAIVRFLPDLDEANDLPWIAEDTIKLPFYGTINAPEDRDLNDIVTVAVPCLSTWGKDDPITRDIKDLWRGDEDERAVAKTYWRKRAYLMAALIVSAPFVEKEVPDSPVRLLKVTAQLHACIVSGLTDVDVEYAPFDFSHGRDFKINKTKQGVFANYSTSSFAYRERALSPAELGVIETHGLIDLGAQAGKQPDAATQAIVWEMYQDSLNARAFDYSKYGDFGFRAYGKFGADDTANKVSKSSTKSVDGEALLAMIRDRSRAA